MKVAGLLIINIQWLSSNNNDNNPIAIEDNKGT